MERKMLIIMLVAAFSVSMPGLGFAGGMGKEGKGHGDAMGKTSYQGTVSKVDGNTITLRDAECQEQTVMAKNEEEAKDIKAGDHVSVHDGRVTKVELGESSGYGPSGSGRVTGTDKSAGSFPGENC